MEISEAPAWRKCSTCKKSIGFKQKYFVCSVSTCNGQRTGYVFCSIPCWETHVPGAKHRDAAAIEMLSPSSQESSGPSHNLASSDRGEKRRIIVSSPNSTNSSPSFKSGAQNLPREILIVASKLKDYIRARSEMNTSAQVMDVLSDHVRRLCDDAIDRARSEGRKTVLDRDFEEK